MVEQIDLVLAQLLGRDAVSAQWAEAGVDAVNRAGLRRQRLHQLAAALEQRPGLRRQFTRSLERGDLPEFPDGKAVPVELNHAAAKQAETYISWLEREQ